MSKFIIQQGKFYHKYDKYSPLHISYFSKSVGTPVTIRITPGHLLTLLQKEDELVNTGTSVFNERPISDEERARRLKALDELFELDG